MHIYQGERNLQDENRALAIPGGFQVDKEIVMFCEHLSQVRNNLNTTLLYIIDVQFVFIMLLGRYSFQICFRYG